MKKIIEKHILGFWALLGVMMCLLIILGVYVYCDVRNDNKRDNSLAELFATEMYNSADMLYSELNSGNYIAAYHYSKSAEEYAARANLDNEGRLFAKIAFEIENNRAIDSDMSDALLEYLRTGEAKENTAAAEITARQAENEDRAESESVAMGAVSKYRISLAEKSAGEVIGVDKVLHLCEKNIFGELLFTCRNAYAVIDEKTGRPLESMLSLERSGGNLSIDEGIKHAYEFVGKFYPRSSVASLEMENAVTNLTCGTYDITFVIDGRETLVSVKCDSGKAVRIVAR